MVLTIKPTSDSVFLFLCLFCCFLSHVLFFSNDPPPPHMRDGTDVRVTLITKWWIRHIIKGWWVRQRKQLVWELLFLPIKISYFLLEISDKNYSRHSGDTNEIQSQRLNWTSSMFAARSKTKRGVRGIQSPGIAHNRRDTTIPNFPTLTKEACHGPFRHTRYLGTRLIELPGWVIQPHIFIDEIEKLESNKKLMIVGWFGGPKYKYKPMGQYLIK